MANYQQMSEEALRQTMLRIKSYPIIDYAAMIGLQPIKRGNFYTLREHDSVVINPNTNMFYRNSNDVHGDIMDFSVEFEGKTPKEAYKTLSALVGTTTIPYTQSSLKPLQQSKKANKVLTLPAADSSNKNVYAYLIHSRKIDKSIVDMMIKQKNLYQDTKKNCVFVSYDRNGKAEFASLRGTNTYKRFVADIAGSNYHNCFYLNNNAHTMIVSESVIDSMSVMSIMQQAGRDLSNYNYLSLNGVPKYPAVKNHLLEQPEINQVVLAVDNDEAGLNCIENIKDDLAAMNWRGRIIEYLPSHEKDWNAELQRIANEDSEESAQRKREQSEEVEM